MGASEGLSRVGAEEETPVKPVLTVTLNPTVDIATSVEHVVPDRKLGGERATREPGGGGINVSRALRKLGGRSRCLHTAGGATGAMLEALLDGEGIEHEPMPIDGWTREGVHVLERASGQQYRIGLGGPALSEEEAAGCARVVEQAIPEDGYLVLSGSLPAGVPRDLYRRLARRAAERGTRTIVDCRGAALEAVLDGGRPDLIKPNVREFRDLFETPPRREPQMRAAARELVAEGRCGAVAISLGSAGVLAATQDGVTRLRAPTVHIRSKVGAGDSMVAGVVLALASGDPLDRALRAGVAAGAAAVITPGSELCRREDFEELLAAMEER